MDSPRPYFAPLAGKPASAPDYTGRAIPAEALAACTAPEALDGPLSACAYWVWDLQFFPPAGAARDFLRRTGGWSDEELSRMSYTETAAAVLWVACDSIARCGTWLGLALGA